MCQFQQLFSDEKGYVIRCNKCSNYQVLFSGTMLSINTEEFEQFLSQIANYRQRDEFSDPQVRSVVLPTPRQGVHLLVSKIEFNRLQHMMESAESEIKALAILELFN